MAALAIQCLSVEIGQKVGLQQEESFLLHQQNASWAEDKKGA
jgi:hypothetical protein